jgi:hypothetical protein
VHYARKLRSQHFQNNWHTRVRLSALYAGHLLSHRKISGTHFWSLSNPRAVVQLEGFSELIQGIQ